MTTATAVPSGAKLLLPSSGYGSFFQLSRVCEQICRLLCDREWNVPGIETTLSTYGPGNVLAYIQTVTGSELQLRGGMNQGRVYDLPGNQFDLGGLTDIIVPGKHLVVAPLEGKPDFYVYAGSDWDSDREAFMAATRRGCGRRVRLHYVGGCKCTVDSRPHGHSGRFSSNPLFIHTTDFGRERDLEPSDPETYVVDEVYAEMTAWLQENVLDALLPQ